MEAPSYREHELAFRTQYAELKERTLAAGALLPGTPGSLALRSGTGSVNKHPALKDPLRECLDG